MARIPNFYGYNERSQFLLGKKSALTRELPGIKYFQKTKHTRNQGSLEGKFLFSFDSQIYPTILPGVVLPSATIPLSDLRILSELSQPILTELGNYIILE